MTTTVYTDEMLDHNFHTIEEFMETLRVALNTHADILEQLRRQLPKASNVTVNVPKRSKLIVVGVVVGSAYFGYKVALSRVGVEINKMTSVYDKKPANTTTETRKD